MPSHLVGLQYRRLKLHSLNNPDLVIGEATTEDSTLQLTVSGSTASFPAGFAHPTKPLGVLAHSHPDNTDR